MTEKKLHNLPRNWLPMPHYFVNFHREVQEAAYEGGECLANKIIIGVSSSH